MVYSINVLSALYRQPFNMTYLSVLTRSVDSGVNVVPPLEVTRREPPVYFVRSLETIVSSLGKVYFT